MSHMVAGTTWLFFCLVVSGTCEKNDFVASKILAGYNKNVAPDFTKVQIDLQLITIDNLDEEKGVLSLDTWFGMYWTDKRLTWKSSHLENLTQDISLPSSLLWIPDITLYNSANGFTKFDKEIRAYIRSDGSVVFVPPIKFKSRCYIDPIFHDKNVTCALKFGSWTFNGLQMDLESKHERVVTDDYFIPNSNWVVVNSSMKRDVTRYDCCPEVYLSVTYGIVIKRQDENAVQDVILNIN